MRSYLNRLAALFVGTMAFVSVAPLHAELLDELLADQKSDATSVLVTKDCLCAQDVCCDDGRGFYVQADALVLKRVPRSLNQPVVLDTAGATVLTTRDLDLPMTVGPRLTVGFCPDACHAWEAVYFGTHYWHAAETVRQANDLRVPGDLAAATLDFLFADEMRIDYSAQLHNVEINRWQHRDVISWLAGFRYLNLDETFNIHARDVATGGSDYRIDAENNLFGGQLGARLEGCIGRMGWDVTGKAGVFGNAGRQSTFVGDFDNTFVVRNSANARSNVAMIADVGLNFDWQLCRAWSIRGGYNVMWVEGVVLAPDQLDFTNLAGSGTAVHNGGGIFLHGAHVGLAADW